MFCVYYCSVSCRSLCNVLFQVHSYCLPSPRKLRKTIDILTKRLLQKSRVIKNTRRREKRLRGKISDLINKLRDQRLLTENAEEMLEAYKGTEVS